jgi:PAS domain-containing protein
LAEAIVDAIREPLLVLDPDFRVIAASRSFYRTFAVTPRKTEGQLVFDLGDGQWNIPGLRTVLEDIIPKRVLSTPMRSSTNSRRSAAA